MVDSSNFDGFNIKPRGKKGVYSIDYWHEGKHRRKSLKTTNLKAARERAAKLLANLINGAIQPAIKPIEFCVAIGLFIQYLLTEGRARKTTTRYRGMLEKFAAFANKHGVTKLGAVTVRLVDAYRSETKKELHPVSMHKEAACLKGFLRWAQSRQLIATNPLRDVHYTRARSAPRGGPTLEQINKILDAASPVRFVHLAILAFTGMRSGELRYLRGEDIDLDGNWIHIVSRPGAETKTRESRKVPIHPRLRPILAKLVRKPGVWLLQEPPSFKYPQGGNWINTKRLNEDLLKLLKQLGIKAGRAGFGYTIHSLRHSFETICTDCSTPSRVVDRWTGHSGDRSMGNLYYELKDEKSQEFMKNVPFGTN